MHCLRGSGGYRKWKQVLTPVAETQQSVRNREWTEVILHPDCSSQKIAVGGGDGDNSPIPSTTTVAKSKDIWTNKNALHNKEKMIREFRESCSAKYR